MQDYMQHTCCPNNSVAQAHTTLRTTHTPSPTPSLPPCLPLFPAQKTLDASHPPLLCYTHDTRSMVGASTRLLDVDAHQLTLRAPDGGYMYMQHVRCFRTATTTYKHLPKPALCFDNPNTLPPEHETQPHLVLFFPVPSPYL